mmetsp:Transcript_111263/g.202355  ORF Transcript_111263/g.202355 Transcript_111263/m.202355 type:complete len:80 (-) Transcript_111263:82-321(-)
MMWNSDFQNLWATKRSGALARYVDSESEAGSSPHWRQRLRIRAAVCIQLGACRSEYLAADDLQHRAISCSSLSIVSPEQ